MYQATIVPHKSFKYLITRFESEENSMKRGKGSILEC